MWKKKQKRKFEKLIEKWRKIERKKITNYKFDKFGML